MKCKNKEFHVTGLSYSSLGMTTEKLHVLVTNDEKGKTLSIDNGTIQFTIPMDEIIRYLK